MLCQVSRPVIGKVLSIGRAAMAAVTGKLLGHSQQTTTQRYAHLDADPMHKAANLIGAQIVAAMNPIVAKSLPAPKARKPKK